MSFGYVSPYGKVGASSGRSLPVLSLKKRAALLGLAAFGVMYAVQPANADTINGYGSNGACVAPGIPITLWSQSAVGVKNLHVSFRLELHTGGTQVTVAQGGWVLSNGAQSETTYWQNTSTGAGPNDKTFLVGIGQLPYPGDVGTGVKMEAGSSGTVKYVVLVRGYDAASCAKVSDVKVTRDYYSTVQTPGTGGGGGGGGGFLPPTPTPAVPTAAPTVPASATAIPGATPGPGVQCFPTLTGGTACYPNPPAGWCYITSPFDGSSGGQLAQCAAPSPTPSPTPAPANCSGTGHYWCADVTVTTPVAEQVFSGAGYPGTFPGVLGTSYNLSYTASYVSGHAAGEQVGIRMKTSGGSSCAPANSNWGSAAYGTIGTATISTTRSFTIPTSNGNGCTAGGGAAGTPIALTPYSICGNCGFTPAKTIRIVMWIDPVGHVAATPSPTPTHAGVTLPPDYWGPGGATPPPQPGVDVEVNVDVCEDDPTILACWHSFAPGVDLCALHPDVAACATAPPIAGPGPGDTGLLQPFEDTWNHLMSKAPFAYAAQVQELAESAVANAAGPDLEWCTDIVLSVLGVDVSFCVPIWDYAATAGSLSKPLLTGLLVFVVIFAVGKRVTEAFYGNA